MPSKQQLRITNKNKKLETIQCFTYLESKINYNGKIVANIKKK